MSSGFLFPFITCEPLAFHHTRYDGIQNVGPCVLEASVEAFKAVIFPVEVYWVVTSNSVVVGY
jgi:hypothetical protein